MNVDLSNEGILPSGNSIVLGSVVKMITPEVIDILQMIYEQVSVSGTQIILSLDNQGIKIMMNPSNTQQETSDLVEQMKQTMIDGDSIPRFSID